MKDQTDTIKSQIDSKQIIIKYGLFYGLGLILISLIMYALGLHFEGGIAALFLMAAVIIATIILGIKTFKLTNNSFLSFGQAIKIGVGIAIVGTLLSIVYQQVFINFIEPDFMQQMAERTEEALLDRGFTDEQIEAQMEISKRMSGPFISSAMGLLFYSFVGFVISAIAGAIMKKDEEEQY